MEPNPQVDVPFGSLFHYTKPKEVCLITS